LLLKHSVIFIRTKVCGEEWPKGHWACGAVTLQNHCAELSYDAPPPPCCSDIKGWIMVFLGAGRSLVHRNTGL
jgi:hypothetical protein